MSTSISWLQASTHDIGGLPTFLVTLVTCDTLVMHNAPLHCVVIKLKTSSSKSIFRISDSFLKISVMHSASTQRCDQKFSSL